MKLLNNAIVDDYYDVVVVGAGNGGLTAAAMLAKKGFKVCIVEQHYIPGGCVTSIRRKGIAFDVGAAMLFGWNPETGYKPHVYVMNELQEDINMIPHDSIYRMHLLGKEVTFWRDFEKYFKELVAIFPHQEKPLRDLYKEFLSVYDTLVQGIGALYAPSFEDWKKILPKVLKNVKGVVGLIRNLDRPIQDLLDKYGITDPDLIGLFDFLIATFFTTTCRETPAIMAPVLFIDTHKGGCFYPEGSPQMLPNKMEKAIEKFGGHLIYKHYVEEIVMDKGKATGIRLDDGTLIRGKYIISNATVWNLYGKLIKPEHIKPDRYKWAQSFVPTLSIFILYAGVKAEVIPKDFRSIEVFIEDPRNFAAPNKTFFLFIPTIDDPSIAPEGYHSLSILCPGSNRNWPTYDDPKYRTGDYYKAKEEEADRVLTALEKYIPGIKKAIVTLEVGTAGTMERFTLKNWGCVAGPKQMIGQHMFKRPGARTEWKNVFMVGDSCTFGEGVVSTCSSGISAANAILKDEKMDTYEIWGHEKQYVHLVEGKKRIDYPKKDEELNMEKAQRLSMECNWCEHAYDQRCTKNCPAGIDVSGFIRRIEAGNITGAAREIREMNPLGEICGIICPAEKFCQSKCYRAEYAKEPVEIPRLQAWVCKEAGTDGFNKKISESNGKSVAVIGAGPAGISCAHYLAMLGFKVDVFDKSQKKGGMLSQVIPDFRLSDQVIEREFEGINFNTISWNYGKELGKDIHLADLKTKYNAVFLAPGLWHGKKLNVPGIPNESYDALSFIKAYRDKQPKPIGKMVVIIGGGSVAVDAASVAKKLGAQSIKLVCLECYEEMPCLNSEKEELKQLGVELLTSWGPKAVVNKKVQMIGCCKVYDQNRNFCPEFDESKQSEVEFDTLIMAVGQELAPELKAYLEKEFGTVKLKVDESMKVIGTENIFAGGDIIRGAGTVVQAVADGRKAAIAIDTLCK
jgi:carotene isomerase